MKNLPKTVGFTILVLVAIFPVRLGSQSSSGASNTINLSEAVGSIRYLKASEVSASDRDLLDSPGVQELFRRYNYPWRGLAWRYEELSSPLVHKHAMFVFWGSLGLDRYSRLVLVFNRNGHGKYLIPRQNDSMVLYPNVEDDPHNFAILNGIIALESINPTTALEWFQLGLLYINMIGERQQVTGWEGFGGLNPIGMLAERPKLEKYGLLPRVTCNARDCEVKIFQLYPDGESFVAWELQFRVQPSPPRLVDVSREVQPLPAPH